MSATDITLKMTRDEVTLLKYALTKLMLSTNENSFYKEQSDKLLTKILGILWELERQYD